MKSGMTLRILMGWMILWAGSMAWGADIENPDITVEVYVDDVCAGEDLVFSESDNWAAGTLTWWDTSGGSGSGNPYVMSAPPPGSHGVTVLAEVTWLGVHHYGYGYGSATVEGVVNVSADQTRICLGEGVGVTANSSSGGMFPCLVTWSGGDYVAVWNQAKVYPETVGTATITATVGPTSRSAQVEVVGVESVLPDEYEIYSCESVGVEAYSTAADGAFPCSVNWDSEEGDCSPSAGKATMFTPGNEFVGPATVTASVGDGASQESCTITVLPHVDYVFADGNILAQGTSKAVTITAYPWPVGATMADLRWQYTYSATPFQPGQQLSWTTWSGTSASIQVDADRTPGYYMFRAVNGQRGVDDDWWRYSQAITVIRVESIVASCLKADNSPQTFEGHKPWPFDSSKTPPDKHMVVFYNDVIDSSFNVQDFDVTLTANILPSSITADMLNEVWSKISGPSSGNLNRTDTFEIKYQNPKLGGVYRFDFDLGISGCPKSEANVVLPLAGAEVDSIVSADIGRANTFASTVKARYHYIQRQLPSNGVRWFYAYNAGDYLGRPDNASSPTVWTYNQVTANGYLAVGTWKGKPIRVAKISNFMVGYAAHKINVNPVFAWASQLKGTRNDASATKSWNAGWALADGGTYDTSVTALVADIWDKDDDAGRKNMKLWPNTSATDNYVVPNSFSDPDHQFTSPGFLYMANP